jgi:hypothetical protein
MTQKYLGQELVNWKNIEEFKEYNAIDWAMYYIENYGQTDGGHHSKWVIDQIARILKGCKIHSDK